MPELDMTGEVRIPSPSVNTFSNRESESPHGSPVRPVARSAHRRRRGSNGSTQDAVWPQLDPER
jgi:hypothetical protein